MRCPHCAVALSDPEEHDLPFPLLRCAAHGCFVASDGLDPAMVAALRRELATSTPTKLDCAMCGSTLRQVSSHGLTLDLCGVCDGVWFDKGELERAPPRPPSDAPTRWTYSPLDGVAEVMDRHVEVAEDPGMWASLRRVLRWL